VLVTLELEPLRVIHRGARLHAEQRIVGEVVAAVRVVTVVRRQQRCVEVLGDRQQLRIRLALRRNAVVLQLDEQVVAPEDVLQPRRLFSRTGHVAREQ
jgi:ABC-type cobalamin/Fe3+-siderophores transport system ATPase subunit